MNELLEEEGLAGNEECETVNRILSICFEGKKIGIAFYDELNSVIRVSGMFEVSQNDVDRLLSNLKECCQPSLILVQSKTVTNKPLLDLICGRYEREEGVGGSDVYPFQVIKNNYWRYDNAVEDMLHRFSVQSYRPGHRTNLEELSYQENMARLSVCLELDNRPLVSSMGALLHHLRSDIFTLDAGHVRVADIQPLVVDEYLRIDSATFKSLQIFYEDQHPLLYKEKGRSKEGFSLFSLLDRTVSLPGRKRLRGWLSTPYFSRKKILERQDGVEMVFRGSNAEFVGELVKHLRHTHDLPRILLRIKKVNAAHMDWVKLYQTINSALPVIDQISLFLQEPSSPLDTAAASDKEYLETLLVSLNVQVIKNICNTLYTAIDISETKEQKQVTIRAGFDEVLDSLRSIYEHLDDELVQTAKGILQQAPLLSHVSVEYLPQIGYLIAIQEQDQHFLPSTNTSSTTCEAGYYQQRSCPGDASSSSSFFSTAATSSVTATVDDPWHNARADHENADQSSTWRQTSIPSYHQPQRLNQTGGSKFPPEYQHIYSSEGMMYFKHPVVYALDESIGDIHARLLDRQKDLMLEVECEVLECEYHFLQLAVILESLDAIISLGTIAKERNYTRPEIVEDPVVIVKAGRHPLQELNVDNFIPNDIFMSPEKHIGIITGLNGSGKSIYLKQVGLLVFLAHVGSFLPADRAVIGLCDRILTRVSSVESSTCPLSAFMLDLSQLKRMLDLFTGHSLCLIDEFGKGTAPVDGMALLAATIMRFQRTPPCRVLFTTHFLEIFHKDIIDTSRLLSITTFKMDTYEDQHPSYENALSTDSSAVMVQQSVTQHSISATTNENRVTVAPTEEVPLYKLKIGIATSAGGIACARRAGVKLEVLHRAEQLQKCFSQNKVIHPLQQPPAEPSSSEQQQRQHPNPNPNYLLNDFSSQEISVLKMFFDIKDWQTAADEDVQALMKSIDELL